MLPEQEGKQWTSDCEALSRDPVTFTDHAIYTRRPLPHSGRVSDKRFTFAFVSKSRCMASEKFEFANILLC